LSFHQDQIQQKMISNGAYFYDLWGLFHE